MTLTLSLQPANPTLLQRPEQQMCYVLATIQADGRTDSYQAVSWALVADASRSMRIPIITEDQFRQLVRAGGAHEVLVDGVPVWEFGVPVPPDMAASSPSALDHVGHALASVVEHLHHADRLALVACAEDALLLAPSTSGADRAVLMQHNAKLADLHLGEETDLARGLQLGLQELYAGRASNHTRVERIILLTDGFTQNPDDCLHLARQAAAEGISISTFGLGGDFQDDLLTALSDISGGRAIFLRHAEEIPQAVAQELEVSRLVAVRAATLTMHLQPGVMLRRATRITPTLAPVEAIPTASDQAAYSLHLGDLEPQAPVKVLLELLVPPASASHHMRLAHLRCAGAAPHATALAELVATCITTPAAPPAPVLDAAARANAVHLQRRALQAVAHQDHATAIRLLRSVAARLQELGESALAGVAAQEANALEHTGQTTRLGVKELTYATRRLGKP